MGHPLVKVFLASSAFAGGYILLYAATAEGGKYALRPWKTLSA